MLANIKQFVKARREALIFSGNIRSCLKRSLFRFFYWIKKNQQDIILVIGVVLVCLLSFAVGYITAKYQEKIPLKIEQGGSYFYSSEYVII